MNNEQALGIIKQILDVAIQRGVFSKLEDSNTALTALQTITNALKPQSNQLNIINE